MVKVVSKNEQTRACWSLMPVSITIVFWKLLGLFVNIKSIQLPGFDLKHVLDLIRLIKLLSSKKVSNIWFVGFMLKSPKITVFSYDPLYLSNILVNSV